MCHQDGEAEVQQLLGVMVTKEERHKRELEAVRQQCRREAELAQREGSTQGKSSKQIPQSPDPMSKV